MISRREAIQAMRWISKINERVLEQVIFTKKPEQTAPAF
jgi:hypothetical protein